MFIEEISQVLLLRNLMIINKQPEDIESTLVMVVISGAFFIKLLINIDLTKKKIVKDACVRHNFVNGTE